MRGAFTFLCASRSYVRNSTFSCRKKVVTRRHLCPVGDRALRFAPASVRSDSPTCSGDTYGGRRQSRWHDTSRRLCCLAAPGVHPAKIRQPQVQPMSPRRFPPPWSVEEQRFSNRRCGLLHQHELAGGPKTLGNERFAVGLPDVGGPVQGRPVNGFVPVDRFRLGVDGESGT
jgi:hypothetical protein